MRKRKKSTFDDYLTYAAYIRLLARLSSSLRSAISSAAGKSKPETREADKICKLVDELKSMLDDFVFRDCKESVEDEGDLLSVFYGRLNSTRYDFHPTIIDKTKKILDDYMEQMKKEAASKW